MTFEDLIEVLIGVTDRMVEAQIGFVGGDGEVVAIGRFSGDVERVAEDRDAPGHWSVRWEREGVPKPTGGELTLDEGTYEGAEVKGSGLSLENVLAGEDESGGPDCEVIIRQNGLVITLLVYL